MKKLEEIVARVFNINIDKIDENLKRGKTEEWDSFNHLLLITEIEKEMGINFTTSEVEKIKTLKELREIILSKSN